MTNHWAAGRRWVRARRAGMLANGVPAAGRARLAALLVLALGLGGGGVVGAAPATAPAGLEVTLTQNAPALPLYDVLELTFQHERQYANPFFDVAIDVTFTAPSGRVVCVGGFHYGSAEKPRIEVRTDARGRKNVTYTFDHQNLWKARLAPAEAGHWTYTYAFANTQGERATGGGAFDCVADPGKLPSPRPPRNAPHGFVRQHPTNPFRWVFDDGTPYFPIGLQDGFFDGQGVGSGLAAMAMDGPFRQDRTGRPELPAGEMFKVGPPPPPVTGEQYFTAFGQAGFNLLRFSQQNFSMPLYRDLDHPLVQEGVMVDELLTCVRRHGFAVFYGFFGYQNVSAEHPENAEVMVKAQRFMKYSVDRWGAYVDFWEFLNEQKADARWYQIMTPPLRALDPYHHPIATSWERPELPEIEVNAPHWYAGIADQLNCDRQTAGQATNWKKHGKPVIVGEHGNIASKEELKTPGIGGVWDPGSAQRMRIRNWTALFQEISFIFWHTGYAKDGHFMNIYLGPEERGYVRAMQSFADRLDADVKMTTATVSDAKVVRAYGLASRTRAAAYLHHYANHTEEVRGLSVTLDVPQAARGYWYAPATGTVVGQFDAAAGKQTFEAPPFTVDLALLIAPGGPPAPGGPGPRSNP